MISSILHWPRKHQSMPHWQTLKLILSSLIAFNFYLNFNPENRAHFGFLIQLFDLILIPMFVFIAAYASQTLQWAQWRERLWPALIIYVTFQCVDAIPLYFQKQLTLRSFLLFPQYGVWFFLAVPIWQMIFLIFPRLKEDRWALILLLLISFIASVAAKYYLAAVTGFYAFIYYFPFFIVAFLCSDRFILWVRSSPVWSLLGLILAIVLYHYLPHLESLWQAKSVTPFFSLLFNEWLAFLISLLLGLVVIGFAMATDRFQRIAKDALAIYLIHPILCFLFLAGLSWSGIPLFSSLVVILSLITITLSLILAKNELIHWFLSPDLKQGLPIKRRHKKEK